MAHILQVIYVSSKTEHEIYYLHIAQSHQALYFLGEENAHSI